MAASSYEAGCRSAIESVASPIAMNDLDLSCGGLLPLITPLEASRAVYDDRNGSWLTRDELRAASLDLAERIASERKRLVFLFCGVNSETLIGLLGAAAAGHATALIDPSVSEGVLTGLIQAYQPELVLGGGGFGEKLGPVADITGTSGSLDCRAGVEWITRDDGRSSVAVDPALQLLLST